ncbi:MAG: cysteine--tRNA ligase [Opitutales bacterium]
MPVVLHDTMSRETRPLLPRRADGVYGMYCCGPTVYGPAHIGNFRTFVIQDTLRRTLEVAGIKVRHVRNLTDVDDKTIRGAQAAGKTLAEFTRGWTEKFHRDCAALNLLPPQVEPSAVAHIPQQVRMIEALVARGHAYVAKDGSVYFKVCSCPDYGKLSHLDRSRLSTQSTNSAGEANDADEYDRESAADFALWKARKPEDGPNFWPSPWGEGRPGWHIECSAMSLEHLGATFDLHAGGVDLCFPHHENEIAQSECATGIKGFAAHWFHSAHLMVEGEKMSKSLGNLFTLDDLTAKGWSPMEVRWALLSGHYRSPLNFTMKGLEDARSALGKLERGADALLTAAGFTRAEFAPPTTHETQVTWGRFAAAWERLCDDLNVPGALGEVFKVLAHPAVDAAQARQDVAGLARILHSLGITPFAAKPTLEVPATVRALAERRWAAKQARDFAGADALRAQIAAAGWTMLDRKDGYELKPGA